MSYNEQDWVHRTLQFILGAIVGAGAGVWTSIGLLKSDIPMWIFAVGGALLIGSLAAIFGDKFWHEIKGIWRW